MWAVGENFLNYKLVVFYWIKRVDSFNKVPILLLFVQFKFPSNLFDKSFKAVWKTILVAQNRS